MAIANRVSDPHIQLCTASSRHIVLRIKHGDRGSEKLEERTERTEFEAELEADRQKKAS